MFLDNRNQSIALYLVQLLAVVDVRDGKTLSGG